LQSTRSSATVEKQRVVADRSWSRFGMIDTSVWRTVGRSDRIYRGYQRSA